MKRCSDESLEAFLRVADWTVGGKNSRWGLAAAAGRKNHLVGSTKPLLSDHPQPLDFTATSMPRGGLTSFLRRPKMMLGKQNRGDAAVRKSHTRLWRTDFRSVQN